MKATSILIEEHAIIESALDLVEVAIRRLRAGQAIPTEFPTWLVQFIREFADGCHHHKEENVLFPLLEQHGIPRDGGPIGCMLHEHQVGRELVARMRAASEASPFDARAFADAADEYVALLRQHIFKENHVLFPLAEQRLNATDDQYMLNRYAQLEPEGGARRCHHHYAGEVAQWRQRFQVNASPQVAAAH